MNRDFHVVSSSGRSRLHFHLALVACVLSIGGCQSPRYKWFEDVKIGMDKDQVLTAAGGPNSSRRWKDKDRWTYVFWDDPQGRQIREVHFSDGIATYVGPEVTSKISPETQDALNLGAEYRPHFEAIEPSSNDTVESVTQ